MTGVAEVLIETHRDGNDNLVKRVSYTFAEDELTQTTTEYNPANGQQTSKTTLTFGHDGHGSVRVVFGASAALLQAFTYAAFGELLAVHDTTGQSVPVAQALTRMLYSGEATDPNTGMQYLRARWYDTNSGRFATLDPHGGVFENPLTMNKYAYTSGDPISYNDPTGEFEGLAGMMGSMGNMMANFGMRMSQGLRMMKLARNLQRYVKMYQKFMNFIEKVQDYYNLASSITDFITEGFGFPDDMNDVLAALLGHLGMDGGSADSSSSVASVASAAPVGLPVDPTLYHPVSIGFDFRRKQNSTHRKNLNKAQKNWELGLQIVYRIGKKIIGSNVGEYIGEYGATMVMRRMGYIDNIEMEQRPGGIDIVMEQPKAIPHWAIVEAKGRKGGLEKKTTNYGQQMDGKWIKHNMDEINALKGNKNSDAGKRLERAWNRPSKFVAAVAVTKFTQKVWGGRIVAQLIQNSPGFGNRKQHTLWPDEKFRGATDKSI